MTTLEDEALTPFTGDDIGELVSKCTRVLDLLAERLIEKGEVPETVEPAVIKLFSPLSRTLAILSKEADDYLDRINTDELLPDNAENAANLFRKPLKATSGQMYGMLGLMVTSKLAEAGYEGFTAEVSEEGLTISTPEATGELTKQDLIDLAWHALAIMFQVQKDLSREIMDRGSKSPVNVLGLRFRDVTELAIEVK